MIQTQSNIKLTIAFNDPSLDDEEKDQEVQKLLIQMKSKTSDAS